MLGSLFLTQPDSFNRCFRNTARAVRARRFVHSAAGSLAGGLWACAAWMVTLSTGHLGDWRVVGYATIVCGVGLGLLRAWVMRWTDPEVALWLDAKLDSHELLTTTLEVASDSRLVGALQRRAIQLLQSEELRPLLPHWMTNRAGWLVAGVCAAGWFPANPLRPTPTASANIPVGSLDAAQVAPVERLTRLVDVSMDTAHQARLKRVAEVAQRALKPGVPGAPSPASARELHAVVAAELAQLRADLAAPSSVLELFRDSDLSDARAALERADPGAFARALRQLAQSDEAPVRERARQALERARTLPATRRVLATLLDQELRRFIADESRHLQPITPPPPARIDAPSAAAPGGNVSKPAGTASVNEPAAVLHPAASEASARHLGPRREPGAHANWAAASEHGEPVDADAQRRRERSTPEAQRSRPFDPASLVDQHEALAAAARSLDPRSRENQSPANDATPPQSGLPGDGPAGKRAQQPSAGSLGASGEHTTTRERAADIPRPTIALDGTPPLQMGSPFLQVRPGRGQAPKFEGPARPRANRTSPTPPELLEGVEHADIPSEYRDQVRRYFSP